MIIFAKLTKSYRLLYDMDEGNFDLEINVLWSHY